MISLKTTSPDERLRIYLNDHLAGASGGVSLAKRIRDRNKDNAVGTVFTELVPDLESDEKTLRDIIAAFEFASATPKQVIADVVERVARLKLNGQILGYSLLSRMEELEMMAIGIAGKAKMWSALQAIAEHRSELSKFDLGKLEVQARLQHDRVEELRLDAAREALGERAAAA